MPRNTVTVLLALVAAMAWAASCKGSVSGGGATGSTHAAGAGGGGGGGAGAVCPPPAPRSEGCNAYACCTCPDGTTQSWGCLNGYSCDQACCGHDGTTPTGMDDPLCGCGEGGAGGAGSGAGGVDGG